MHQVAVIAGDGIGPEVVAEGIKIVEAAARQCGFKIGFTHFPWGANHYLSTGTVMPKDGLERLRELSAAYLGAVGDPRVAPGILERGIVGALRWDLDLYVNLRPLKLYHPRYSPLKQVPKNGFDLLVVRENTEDLYTGPGGSLKANTDDEVSLGIAYYTRKGVSRILRHAFERAAARRKKITLCDKANAIPAQEIWRRLFHEIGEEFPDVVRETIYVDTCAMALVRRPEQFDVIVTTNLFGDILTDLGAELCGGVGLAASANLHPDRFGMFEPIHGSAPKYAGKKQANPLGAILAGSLMLDYLGEKKGADLIEDAVRRVLDSGTLQSLDARAGLPTQEIGNLVLEAMKG